MKGGLAMVMIYSMSNKIKGQQQAIDRPEKHAHPLSTDIDSSEDAAKVANSERSPTGPTMRKQKC